MPYQRSAADSKRTGCLNYVIALAVFVAIGNLWGCVSDFWNTKELEHIESEVQTAIAEERYDEALRKTKEMVPPSSASHEKKAYWSAKQDEYRDEIIPLKRGRDATDPSYIPAPASSEELKGMQPETAEQLFRDAGFTNVEVTETVPSRKEVYNNGARSKVVEKPLSPPYSYVVSGVAFGPLTNFTTEDYCKRGDEIVIHCTATKSPSSRTVTVQVQWPEDMENDAVE